MRTKPILSVCVVCNVASGCNSYIGRETVKNKPHTEIGHLAIYPRACASREDSNGPTVCVRCVPFVRHSHRLCIIAVKNIRALIISTANDANAKSSLRSSASVCLTSEAIFSRENPNKQQATIIRCASACTFSCCFLNPFIGTNRTCACRAVGTIW